MWEQLIPGLGPVIQKLVNLIPDPAARAAAQAEADKQILDLATSLDKEQIEVNKIEAANTSLFVSGWRPFVGWVCGAGVAWAFVVKPFFDWFMAAIGHKVESPILDTASLLTLLGSLLGMGGMRMLEKKWGVASK